MIYAVIMAGGSGTRFWPESRKNKPKQFLNINGEKTMIQATIERILPEIPYSRIMVVTAASHVPMLKNQVPELHTEMIVSEPCGRNTAPCVALAAYKLRKIDPDAVMVVLPADHLISREDAFLSAMVTGVQRVAQNDELLTFGIVPDRPETGYGYIRLGTPLTAVDSYRLFHVEKFVEKPDLRTAEDYVATKHYVWNSGMFVWSVSAIIKAIENYLPAVGDAMASIFPELGTPEESTAIERVYDEIDAISIDYGIMERATNVLCMPLDVGWNDVGSWASLGEVLGCDDLGNSSRGQVVSLDTNDCIVLSRHRLTALIGVEDLIIVDTPDALLICRKDRAQDVKKLQETLGDRNCGHVL